MINFLDNVRIPDLIEEKPCVENFELYLNRLHQICMESHKDDNKAIFAALKQVSLEYPIETWVCLVVVLDFEKPYSYYLIFPTMPENLSFSLFHSVSFQASTTELG